MNNLSKILMEFTYFVKVLGLAMPVVANILPIQRALGRTLRDSLDVYHHVASDVSVRVLL